MSWSGLQCLAAVNNPTLACASESDILRRREQVAALRNRGFTVADIAKELNVDPATVSRDVKYVCNYYLSKIIQHRNVWMADALEKLENTEKEAWQGFYRSIGIITEKTREISDDGVKTRITKKPKAGDPRFLALALKCQQQRSLLLGLLNKEQIRDIDRIGIKKPKMLVVRDRQQHADLVDVSSIKTVEVIDTPTAKEEISSEKEPF